MPNIEILKPENLLLPVITELNIGLLVILVNNLVEWSQISDELKNESRLLSIFSVEITPGNMLDKFGFGCYSLHPGSNEYPG